MIDFHELLRGGISTETGAVAHNLAGKIRADTRKVQKRRAVGLVDVQFWNDDVRFKAVIDGVCHHIGFCKVLLTAKPATLLPIIINGQGLLLTETKPL